MILYRSRRRRRVHLATCRYAVAGRRWEWSESAPPDLVVRVMIFLHMSTCRCCRPLERI